MDLAKWALLALLMLPGYVPASAQNNCSVSPPTGTCAAPPPVLTWCAGNNSNSTCSGGTSWIGFSTSSPAAGSWSNQFEGLDAASIRSSGTNSRPQPDPNGGVGPTNSSGIGQYLEFSANEVQAFDRKTGNGILSSQPGGGATPRPMSALFSPGGKNYCGNGSLDGIATYDRIDRIFVLANIYNPGGNTTYYYCIGVSAPSGPVPASNLEGSNNQSRWNVYAYSINSAIPHDSAGHLYFPDYQRFGTWSDGFYVAWDLEDTTQNYDIVGFEVCKLDKANIIAGLSSNPPVCYTYIPSYVAGTNGTDRSLIHTLLPADFEGNKPIPSNTAGEYFLAQVNPSNPGTNDQCTVAPCTSDQLAFWTWSGFTSGNGPAYINFPDHPFTPGCYNLQHPYDTTCVPEPYGGPIDGLGDRLNYRLAYRHLSSGSGGEYLAVAQTVQENATTQRTGLRFYVIAAGSSPAIAHIGEIQDSTYHLFASMPSVAMDANGDVGITFTVTGNTKHGSAMNYDPSPFFIAAASGGKVDAPVAILSNSGASGQDETDDFWGEYVSVSSDPNDDLTFWAVDEYMAGNQTGNCTSKVGSGCNWATRVFTCKKGSGC
ncbi:MAG: hypothetical protein WAL32_09115 [Terriglobales bacterium]